MQLCWVYSYCRGNMRTIRKMGGNTREGALRLFNLYNKVWEEDVISAVWKEAVIITIRKPEKDATKPTSYGLIALTSHVGK